MAPATPRLRWLVFFIGAAAFFLSFFHRVAPGAIAGELVRAFDVHAATLGALAATYFYIYTVMQLPTGVLVDTLGPRRVLAAGGLVAGVGSIAFGVADTVAGAALGRTLAGLGVSVAFISLLKLTANWFEERTFATASGAAQVIGIAGAFFATAPLAWLVTIVSWRSVFMAVGVVSLALAGLTLAIVRDSPGGDSAGAADNAAVRWPRALAAVMRNRATWPCFWVNFGISGSYMSFIGLWAVPFLAQTYGLTPVAASRHTSAMLVAFAISVALVGVWSDRLRRRKPLIVGSAALYWLFWIAWISGMVTPGMTYAACALMGFVATGFTLSWACAKEVNPREHAGMATGLANTGGFLAAGILQPLVGWVLDYTALAGGMPSFRAALAVLALFAFGGLVAALFIRETGCRNIGSPQSVRASR
ncbi:MAG TPA: MFS transporter [Burkholderiales bacterium]|nr:MFS transporter [Burkholderiales bacterium]